MPKRIVDVLDADGRLVRSYPITLVGHATEGDFVGYARKAAREDEVISADGNGGYVFRCRNEPGL